MVSFHNEELLAICPTAKLGLPIFGSATVYSIYICSYLVYWRLLLHLESEDVPCLNDRDPLIMKSLTQYSVKSVINFTMVCYYLH